jgi:L-2-hydroxyglutarate oxidase LhgO
MLSGDEARRLEPALRCVGALRSPSTGVVDAAALVMALQGDVAALGGLVVPNYTVQRIDPDGADGFVKVATQAGEFDFDAVINCAGLYAVDVAGSVLPGSSALAAAQAESDVSGAQVVAPAGGSNSSNLGVKARFAKGNYFKLQGVKAPFKRLIYPVPEVGGLGVHVTIDVTGQARFGPDVEWLPEGTAPEAIDWAVNAERASGFYAAIRTYWPGLPDGSLVPDYAGVRPKLEGETDFVVLGRKHHGMRNVVHALGIESPGLTSSLALGKLLADTLEQQVA